jgi:hypothetical protein
MTAAHVVAEATQVRLSLASTILFLCAGCTALEKPAAQAPAPRQAAVAAIPVPVAEPLAKFECSDGTISTSQDACLVAMARARLPPGQTMGQPPPPPTISAPPTAAPH